MRTAVLCSIALTSAATAFAQTPIAPPAPAPQTTTLTGCVLGGTKSRPITLTNALALPVAAATSAPAPASATTADEPPATSTRSAGAAAMIRGTAPAGSSSSSVGGYRLSGADMTSWIGRRVQLVGSLVSSPTASSARPVGTSGTLGRSDSLPMPEFRVVSVQPITGACPAK